jgi:hypothetical protein
VDTSLSPSASASTTGPDPVLHYQRALDALRDGAYQGLNAELRRHLITKLQHDLDTLTEAQNGHVPLPLCALGAPRPNDC